ncbi:fructosamine kinase family protein [Nocardioides daeguensis]|uniref:Fructosamine kinase family protein n=1 Tax=Nocardioides daeguensis TaxID=908359 RepID=A0ABP6VIZ6_9ACTN|nr:fructosamine kinase family protein [Nocardioides daeguensis]MBV6728857.1 fructosamine kinase family protein [Nocardioides daeguensis]MCR1773378.1 fructosamine kinase family protein [Nocardioides daeguensis]
MARQPVVAGRAEQLLGSAVVATAPVAGGDVSTAVKLRLSSGRTAFLKTLSPAPPQFFAREAAGLRWLAEATPGGGVATAEVLAVDSDCLILEWVEAGRPTAEAAGAFGRALAATHAYGASCFGLDESALGGSTGALRVDGYIGRLPLPNRSLPTWAEFHAERRIAPYLKVLRDKEIVSAEDAALIETAAARCPSIVPEEPPARLHGDLWNGNVLWAAGDRAVVVDPAAYGGHREVDLAMLALFGLPQLPQVMAAYTEAHPLADGWEDRLGYHQLFPLLVHACLFGGQYGARAAGVAQRYL